MVSVIIPNYNHSQFLYKRINSVLEQTYKNFEIIILDDNSTDKSREIIESFKLHPQVSHIILNKLNSGSTFRQWKKGIEYSKGNYIWIAESDDLSENSFLEKIVYVLDSKPDVGLVYCHSKIIDENDKVIGEWEYNSSSIKKHSKSSFFCKGKVFIKKSLVYGNSIPNASSVVLRKESFNSAVDFDTNYTINGDWIFYIKLLLKTNIYFVSEPLNYFRKHTMNGSSSNVSNFNNIEEYYKIVDFLVKHIDLTTQESLKLNSHVFHAWFSQADNNFYRLFTSNFFNILKAAYKVDRLIFFKLLSKF